MMHVRVGDAGKKMDEARDEGIDESGIMSKADEGKHGMKWMRNGAEEQDMMVGDAGKKMDEARDEGIDESGLMSKADEGKNGMKWMRNGAAEQDMM
ncbi:hypothetical protein NDU88_000070 [Pleurodeles waltl]|uniref:Uncharacterized protein n=1 Tax=Pleurodeles waltl TaxID=8319 RepID=A0AAV7KN29_PLEWA|nr:hypothetical protein NDU88_000070 [Pleurodeles waltl]